MITFEPQWKFWMSNEGKWQLKKETLNKLALQVVEIRDIVEAVVSRFVNDFKYIFRKLVWINNLGIISI